MKKILLIILFLISIFALFKNDKKVYAFSHVTSEIYQYNDVNLYLENDICDYGDIIYLQVFIDLSNDIIDYNFIENGFAYSEDILFFDDKIVFSVVHDYNNMNPYLRFEILLDNGVIKKTSLYGYGCENKLYLSVLSYDEAFEVYKYYNYPKYDSNSMPILKNSDSSNLRINDLPNTYVEGILQWKDDNNVNHPLQFFKVQLWDRQPIIDQLLLETYTNEYGEYYFEFHNADQVLDYEDGGYDIYIRLMPIGEYVTVLRGNGDNYILDTGYRENVVTGSTSIINYTFTMGNNDYPNYIGRSFQVAQAVIVASKYFEEMNGDDIDSVTVKYPHSEPTNSDFYKEQNRTIYIISAEGNADRPNSYACWDAIMHEYGHFVSHRIGIIDTPGGGHDIYTLMSEHYKKHFAISGYTCTLKCVLYEHPDRFLESDCKYKGNAAAWAEGWATYFSIVSQQYFSTILSNIDTVCNDSYTSRRIGPISLEDNIGVAESTELTVQVLLYDMYDNSSDESFDNLALDHINMWNLFIGSEAKTLSEFNDYVVSHIYSVNLKNYFEILQYHNLSPTAPIATSTLSYNCPSFSWEWVESSDTTYFNNRSYQLNFYDINYNLIGSTIKTSVFPYVISATNTIWSYILNNSPAFYTSITIFEDNAPISSYEGKWSFNYAPTPILVTYSIAQNGVLSYDSCYWYKFIAPQTEEYIFETGGNSDTYGEIFSNIVVGHSNSNVIDYDDDSGASHNFRINYNMYQGQVVYIRVRGYNWSSTGAFSFIVSSTNHIHFYNYNYVFNDIANHRSYCSCGNYLMEAHDWYWDATGYRCQKCGYFTTGPIINSKNNGMVGHTIIYFVKKEDDII